MKNKYIKEFNNLKYGKCYLLAERKNWYLVSATNCPNNNYIVCTYIDNMGTMMGQHFFGTVEKAQEYFNKKEI